MSRFISFAAACVAFASCRVCPNSKVTPPSVNMFLSSMGILVGEESHIVDKEVNEVSILRRVRPSHSLASCLCC